MLKSLATLAIVFVALTLAPKAEADETFKATLTGDQEAPPVGPVDTDTTGRVRIHINKTETEGEFTLIVNEGVRVTQAHLHCGAVGVNGPIVVFLAGLHAAGLNVDGKWISNASFTDTSIVNPSCGTTIAALVASMRAGNVYANVHTVAHPQGEIRGQVEPTAQD
jgi:hypothetical protein